MNQWYSVFMSNLKETHPALAAQWSDKNTNKPEDYTAGSNYRAWWSCADCGNEWHAAIVNRANRGTGCRVCSRRKRNTKSAPIPPSLVAQWSKRNNIHADALTCGSDRKVWWVCGGGHEWEATVANRVAGSGCPACSSAGARLLVVGFNDLATTHPHLASQWSVRNDYGPDEVSRGAKRKAWWLCADCGYEWQSQIKGRATRGTGCPSCRSRKRGKEMPQWLQAQWGERNTHPATFYSAGSNIKAWWVCDKGHEWEAVIADRVSKATQCRRCTNNGTSGAEQDLRAYVESLGLVVSAHDRTIKEGFEYDIVVPSKNVAIEYNGLYWHSEEYKPRNYHALKADVEGWNVIHIWEDDWLNRPEVVKRMLARKLGVSEEVRHNARELEITTPPVPLVREFMDENHIQGFVRGTAHIALEGPGGLVAVMTFLKRKEGVYGLERYATSGIVRGGFTKLLRAFTKQDGVDQVVTFSDHGVSDGGLYAQSGFVRDGEIAPDYRYVVHGRREHKFSYRKERFKKDPKLRFEEGLTERELAELNGLKRIYDAGKTRWSLVL